MIQVLHPTADVININAQVWNMYFRNLLPGLVKEGDDGNYGSAELLDALCLQVYVFKPTIFKKIIKRSHKRRANGI